MSRRHVHRFRCTAPAFDDGWEIVTARCFCGCTLERRRKVVRGEMATHTTTRDRQGRVFKTESNAPCIN